MANFVGNIGIFDPNSQEWDVFYGRLTQFIKLNKIEDSFKSAVLLTHLSDESYRLVRNLIHPDKLEDKTFTQLVEVLSGHFTPKRSTFADRAKFFEATKSAAESSQDWAARLRGLAVNCEFGTELQTLLRDRFVLGFNMGPERDRLFESDSKTLTLSKALEIAQQAACARQARAQVVKEEPLYRAEARAVRRGAGAAGPASGRKDDDAGGSRCAVCGLKNHDAARCRFRNYKCQNCGKKGHLKKMCGNNMSKLHNIDTDLEENQECNNCKECQMFNMRYVNCKPVEVSVDVYGLNFLMELDSGSGCSVMSADLYRKHFHEYNLHKNDLKMCFYTGHQITPLGYFMANVVFENKQNVIRFYVIANGGPPLLGRDFMSKFNIGFTTAHHGIKHSTDLSKVQNLLERYPDIWEDKLGCFNKFEVELNLKENAEPKFFKPRSVPFALKDRVSAELDRLVELGILIPVNYSEYATPIVPVLKENGKLKIAGDFSCTLNKDLKIDKYPLPRIEEVFAKLGGGLQYTKIDLSNAYNQFKLTEASQKLTTINTHKGLFSYTRLVYGLANAPSLFQKAMETLLSGLEGVSVWLDDVCITGPTYEVHLARLEEVLKRLNDAGLRLQKDKCAFLQDHVTYLGYVIDKNGLKTCPNKVEAILKAPAPENVLGIKRFLGVVNYYRNFIPNASAVLSPLHELLRADAEWCWGARQQAAFDSIKRELAGERVLAHFDPDADISLAVDAGPAGLGSVLSHVDSNGQERPIAFASRSLSGTAWQVSRRVANVLTSNAFIVLIISLELLAWRSGAAALANCPSGCNCNDDTLVVVCEESRLDVLPIALNPSIQRLIIRNNKIKTIDSSMQFYAELQHLDLSQNHLVNIPTKSFAYQRKLQELHLNHNKISSVTNTTFQGLNSLTVLNLKRNFLEELTNGVFSTLPRLEELNLGQNRISRIEPKAFAGLTALRILYLDDNQLSSVPTASFSLLGSLAELHVGLNAFSNLPDDTFAGLNRLAVLDLNGAGLFNISENAFRGLPGLRSLNLFGNRLSVVPTQQIGGLTRLEELYIGQNDFLALESHSFKGLKNLKLLDITGAAQLERVEKGALEDNINLETVVLANNKKLAILEEGTLMGLPKLKHVTLKDNAIITISESVFVGKELKQLDITDNPIFCDCQLLWLHELLNEKSNFTQIQCASPDHLKDKYLRALTADGLGCAVHDTRQQTIICVVVVACVATLASIVLVLYRYRKSMHEKLKDYKWNKRAMRKDLEYHKPISTEEDCIVRGIHPAQYPAPHAPGLRPIPVTEL